MGYSITVLSLLCVIGFVCFIVWYLKQDGKAISLKSTEGDFNKLSLKNKFNPDEVVTFNNQDYLALYKHFKEKVSITPVTDPYAFNILCKDLALKFITLGLSNPSESLKETSSYFSQVKPRVKNTSIPNWVSILFDYRRLQEQAGICLSDYVSEACSLYAKILTSNSIFVEYPILTPESNYCKAVAQIARKSGGSSVYHDTYGPALLLYYTLHMQTVVKILENQKQASEGGVNTQAYLKYLEDELGLSKLDLDKGMIDFIKPPTSPISTDMCPIALARGILYNE